MWERLVRRGAAVVVVAALGAAVVVSVVSASTDAGAAPCRGSDLSGTFSAVPGSAGAGQISYVLRLRNRSSRACFVSGLPAVRLLGKTGRALPTRVAPAHPGALTAVRVVLAPGGYAAATARFSPDVPGVGEQAAGPCEPTAYRIRVTPPAGSGTLLAPVRPPTSVCERGRMVFSVVVAGRSGPVP